MTLGEFVVSALMALAAGAFRDVEAIKHQALRVEGDDGRSGT